MREYTVHEANELRRVIENKFLWGTYNPPIGDVCSRSYNETEKILHVNGDLHTYMLAGITAQDLLKSETQRQPNYISVCKNAIASNNKRGWVDPDPAIRVSHAPSGKVQKRAHKLAIKDKDGNIVATIISTQDGEPVIKCGAKVAIITEYETEVID